MKHLATLSQLMIFEKVARTNNLSKAASELGITPSAVSKSLSLLEKRIGVLLLKRTSRHTALTDAGMGLLGRISRALRDIDVVLNEIDSLKTSPKGILRITCPVALGSFHLMALVQQYMDLNKDIDVRVSMDDRNVNLNEENFDLALRITAGTDWNYTARKLGPIKWVYCASPSYLSRHGVPSSIEDILDPQKHRFLSTPVNAQTGRPLAFDKDQSLRLTIEGSSDCNNSVTLMVAALNGTGIASLPTYIAGEQIREGKLTLLAFNEHPEIDQVLYAMYFHSRHTNPIMRTFIDFLVDKLKPIAPWDAGLEEMVLIGTGRKSPQKDIADAMRGEVSGRDLS